MEVIEYVQRIRSLLQEKQISESRDLFRQLIQLHPQILISIHLNAILRDFYLAGLLELEIVFEFLESLPCWQWTLDGCVVLQEVSDVLRTSSNRCFSFVVTLPLAYFVHSLLHRLEDAAKIRAESYWYEWFPSSVRAIVMGHAVQITAQARHEVLYASENQLSFDSDRRNVFLWPSIKSLPSQKDTQWILLPANGAKDRFYIQSSTYKEYLYAADYAKFRRDIHGDFRSRVFTWRKGKELPGEMGQWQLVPVAGADRDTFAIYNPYQKEFLYAPEERYDQQRRYVLTMKHRFRDVDWMQWRQWNIAPMKISLLVQGIEAFFLKRYAISVDLLTKALEELPDHTEHVKCFAYRMAANLKMQNFDAIPADIQAIEALGGEKAAIFHGLHHIWKESLTFLDMSSLSKYCHLHHMARGDSHWTRKEYCEALSYYEYAKESVHHCKDITVSQMHQLHCATHMGSMKCLWALGRIEEALQVLEELLVELEMQGDRSPLPLQDNFMLAYVHLWRAKCYRKKRYHSNAIAALETASDQCSLALSNSDPRSSTVNLFGISSMLNSYTLPTSILMLSSTLSLPHLRQWISTELRLVHLLEQNANSFLNRQDPLQVASITPAIKGQKSLDRVLDVFTCPLNLELMEDPVMTPNGDTYEREMIERHLECNGHFDPMTRMELTKEMLYPNRSLKTLMSLLLDKNHQLGSLLSSLAGDHTQ